MGLLDSIKDTYYQWEDAYYKFLDGLDEKGIPVYAVIEPLDKIVPSFALIFVLALALVLGLAWLLANTFLITKVALTVRVVDLQQSPLPAIPVQVKAGNDSFNDATNAVGFTKPFEIPRNSDATIIIDKTGFDHFEKTIRVEQDSNQLVVLQESGATGSTGEVMRKKIRVVDQSGQPLIGIPVHLSFSCSNTEIIPSPATATVQNAEYTVSIPAGCGQLVARVTADNFQTIDSYPIVSDPQTIFLSASSSAVEKGSLNVTVLDNGAPVSNAVMVVLYDGQGAIELTRAATQDGTVVFSELDPNTYSVKTVGDARYAAVSQGNIVVTSGQRTSVNVTVQPNVSGSIKIKVVQQGTQTVVENALVTLQKGTVEVEHQTATSDNNGFLTFFVAEDVEYNAVVDAQGYCLETRSGLRINPGSYVVELEPFSASCGGNLTVKVVDQDGKAVANAAVALANQDHFFIGKQQQLSDLNGEAVFEAVPAGTYAAFAFKGTVSGWSDPQFFNRKKGDAKQIDLTVTMQIPNGTLHVKAVDKDGTPVAFPTFFFVDTSTNEVFGGGARPGDGQGLLDFETRADKKVFFIVQKNGFASFVSAEYDILPQTVQEITVKLLPPVAKFEVELVGLFQGNLNAPPSNNAAVSLANGQQYVAKFLVKVPQENAENADKKPTELGLHVRTGDDTIMEKDLLVLKKTNAPQASVVKGTSFTGDYDTDSHAITNGDAKWANVVWNKLNGSVTEVDAVVAVKPSAAVGKKLSIWYRAWMKIGGSVTKDPVDNSGATNELYSDAKLASYLVGTGTLCDDRFCFDVSVRDPETELIHVVENNSFGAKVKHSYTLNFSIANISPRDVDSFKNAEFRFKNPEETIRLQQYTIFDASAEGSKPVSGNADAFELPRIPIGDLSPQRKFSGTIEFFTERGRDGTFLFQVVDKDRGEVVFEREIQVIVAAEKQLALAVQPGLLVPGIENRVTFTVTDAQTSEPVKDAVVSIRDRFDTLLTSASTNSLGKTIISLPAQAPGENLLAIAEKPDYNAARVVLSVDNALASVEPPRIGFGLNPKTKPVDHQKIVIKNLAQFALVVQRITVNGKFYGLIDEDALNNFFSEFKGRPIAPGKDLEITIPVQLSKSADQLTEPANLNGELTVELTNFGKVWAYPVGMDVSIGLGGEADDPNCLTITKREWKTNTEGKPVSVRFEIQNNCSVNGTPVALQEVESKILWQSNPLGEFKLVTSQSNSILRSGFFKTILPNLPAEGHEVVELTFTPSGGVNGEAKASILFQATNPADKAPQILKTQLDATIGIVNLLDCISFSQEELHMGADLVFAPQTNGFGQIYNSEVFEGSFKDTDATAQSSALAQFGFGGMGSPIFNNGVYNGQNPANFNYGMQPGFSPALGGGGFNQPSPISGRQVATVPVPGTVSQTGGAQDAFTITTSGCGGDVTINLDSTLALSTKQVKLHGDETSKPIIVHGEENFPGQYGVRVSIQGAGARTPKQIQTIPVVIHSNPLDCLQLNKFEFSVFKGNENQGIDTARFYNYCFDKPVPVLLDQHDLHEALAAGSKAASMGFAMGMLSQVYQSSFVTDLQKKKEPPAEPECPGAPSGAKCIGNKIVTTPTGSYSFPIFQTGDGYFYRASDGKIVALEKTGKDQYEVIPPAPPAPPASNPSAPTTQPSGSTAPRQATPSSLTGFQIFYPLPYANGSQSVQKTGDPRIDADRRKAADELASLQTMPVMMASMGGGKDPFSMAFMMYAMGSMQAYQAQEDVRLLTIQTDVELGKGITGFGYQLISNLTTDLTNRIGSRTGPLGDLTSLIGGKLTSELPYSRDAFALLEPPGIFDEQKQQFSGVSVAEYRRPTFAPRRDNQALSLETAYLKIQNDAGVVQKDPLNPLYAILNVDGTRHKYDPDQAYKKNAPGHLREKGTYPVNARFHIQLDSFQPDTTAVSVSQELDNCSIEGLRGSTGANAVPKTKMAWSWDAISLNQCDDDNPEYVYCDATQFSIELLKKLKVLQQFTTDNANVFECPELVSGGQAVEQTLSTVAKDVALTKLDRKTKGADTNFLVTVESNNQQPFQTTVSMTIQPVKEDGSIGTAVKTCNNTAHVLSSTTVGCLATKLPNGAYRVSASLGPISKDCPSCENGEKSNDTIFKDILVGLDSTIVQCEPFSTLRLPAFIEATERAGKGLQYPAEAPNKAAIAKLVNFEAHLMKDGYSNDFRSDFHEFALNKAFFQTPAYYSQEDGLGEYFSNPDKLVFDYFGAPNTPLTQPGTYHVTVDVNFADKKFEWFKAGQPIANIIIGMEKTKDAKPASPFYSLPFDGVIGTDNGRNGYGLNYELLTPDKPVQVNNNASQFIRLSNITGSNPVSVLKASLIDDFATVNNNERGKVLTVDLSTNQLVLSPSLATPVILRVIGTTGRDAYSFYSIESDGQPQVTTDFLGKWNGLGATCKDFVGNDLSTYAGTPDTSAKQSSCAIVGSNSENAFGFEWCDKIKSGSVFLETIFYAPPIANAVVRQRAASNEAAFISSGGTTQEVSLNGAREISLDTPENSIKTVEDVLGLVKDGSVCVSGLDNSQRTEFFWNPKPIIETLQSQRDKAVKACITDPAT